MQLFLARHGNTFNPNDTVVWVGAQNDLPLVPSGRKQAEALGKRLLTEAPSLRTIYVGPLRRVKETATIIADAYPHDVSIVEDVRLNELDYGPWSGKTNEEIAAHYGASVLADWNDRSIWPPGNLWPQSAELVLREVTTFATELTERHGEETVLAVSSNGRLRYFLDLVSGEFAARVQNRDSKMGTGRFGQLQFKTNGWSLTGWNIAP